MWLFWKWNVCFFVVCMLMFLQAGAAHLYQGIPVPLVTLAWCDSDTPTILLCFNVLFFTSREFRVVFKGSKFVVSLSLRLKKWRTSYSTGAGDDYAPFERRQAQQDLPNEVSMVMLLSTARCGVGGRGEPFGIKPTKGGVRWHKDRRGSGLKSSHYRWFVNGLFF